MTFESWIRKQKDRDDPIGDLAKDFIRDYKLKYNHRGIRIKLTEEYLLNARACKEAIKSYKEAKKEFKLEQQFST